MAKWTIDPMHSEIGFKVRHLVISNVSGKFSAFDGVVEAETDDFNNARISFSADINSISTGQSQRDEHLKSADFFDATTYPALTFESTSFTSEGDGEFELRGNLTMHGITNPITLKAALGGVGPNAYGQTIAGFELSGKINRKDFGLAWHSVTEAGGVVLGDDIKLQIDVELVKEA